MHKTMSHLMVVIWRMMFCKTTIQPYGIVAHVQINNFSKLESSNCNQIVFIFCYTPKAPLDIFIQVPGISNEP